MIRMIELCSPWPGALPLQLRGPNYGNGDTNTFSKRMFEQFTEYLTGWQICQVPLSSEGLKTLQLQTYCRLLQTENMSIAP